jgi:hypothetical protein
MYYRYKDETQINFVLTIIFSIFPFPLKLITYVYKDETFVRINFVLTFIFSVFPILLKFITYTKMTILFEINFVLTIIFSTFPIPIKLITYTKMRLFVRNQFCPNNHHFSTPSKCKPIFIDTLKLPFKSVCSQMLHSHLSATFKNMKLR